MKNPVLLKSHDGAELSSWKYPQTLACSLNYLGVGEFIDLFLWQDWDAEVHNLHDVIKPGAPCIFSSARI